MTFPTPAFASAYGPIWSAFGPSAYNKFQAGFLQKQTIPGRNHPAFPGGSFGGSPLPINSGSGLANQGMQFNMQFPAFPSMPTFPNPQWPPLNLPDDSVLPDGDGLGGGGGGGGGSDNVGVKTISSAGGGDANILQATAEEGEDAVIKTLDAGSNITISESANVITITSTAAGGVTGSDTIKVTGTGPFTLSGLYITNDNDFIKLVEEEKTIYNYWGVARITGYSKEAANGLSYDYLWKYSIVGVAGCGLNSDGSAITSTAYNLSEVALRQSGLAQDICDSSAYPSPIVGGVDLCGSSYPAGFEPQPYYYSPSTDSEVPSNLYLKHPYVFIWKDVSNKLQAGENTYFFQGLTPHDGTCE